MGKEILPLRSFRLKQTETPLEKDTGSYAQRKMIWMHPGSKGLLSVTMISFLKNIALLICHTTKVGKIGLRWRTEKEVISGKGQFICGNKHCDVKDGLASYEVNFSYFEAGENKQALVKLILCDRCAEKLHHKRRKEKEQIEKRERGDRIRKRELLEVDDDLDNEGSEKKKRGKKPSISGGS
ncbi:ACID PHOSPHATASE-RELATED [Salix purpurea]|uniref:ACID PHOSPHATASE-RELATED n=1 Tax=Salix purpurea TaxID=77065 RepID=A0A9Q0VU80_SALPP|nr:ACID PHOSPHATASE-RELATED [Salix purpurea]